MFRKVAIFLIILAAVSSQVSIFPNFSLFETVPDIVLVAVIIWTVQEGFEKALPRTILSGIILDMFSFWPIGFNVISFVAVSFLIDFLSRRFLISLRAWRILVMSIFVIIGTVAYYFIISSLSFMTETFFQKSPVLVLGEFISFKGIVKLFLNGLWFFPFYLLLKKAEKIFSLYDRDSLGHKKTFSRM